DHGCVSWRICCSIMQTLFVSDEARKRIDDQLLACEEEQDNSKAGGVDHGRVRDDLRLQHEIAEAARDAKELGDKRDLPGDAIGDANCRQHIGQQHRHDDLPKAAARQRVKLAPISISSPSSYFKPSSKLMRQNGVRMAISTKRTAALVVPNQIIARIAQPTE